MTGAVGRHPVDPSIPVGPVALDPDGVPTKVDGREVGKVVRAEVIEPGVMEITMEIDRNDPIAKALTARSTYGISVPGSSLPATERDGTVTP